MLACGGEKFEEKQKKTEIEEEGNFVFKPYVVFESGLRWQVEGSAPCSISVGRQTGSQRCSLLSVLLLCFEGACL